MKLRNLENRDGPFMLEWMHDADVVQYFRFDSSKNTEEDVREFILKANQETSSHHYAIVDDKDEYLGTISLKNIDLDNRNAEYAICIRKGAMGKNIAKNATDLILKIAFLELKLHKVYLNVLEDNQRAIRFYEKYGFEYEGTLKGHVLHHGKYKDLRYYAIFCPEE